MNEVYCLNCPAVEPDDEEFEMGYCPDCIEDIPEIKEKIQAEMGLDWTGDHND